MYWSRDDSLLFGYDMDIRIKQNNKICVMTFRQDDILVEMMSIYIDKDSIYHTCKVWLGDKMYENFMLEERIPTYRSIENLGKTVFSCYGNKNNIIGALKQWKILICGV